MEQSKLGIVAKGCLWTGLSSTFVRYAEYVLNWLAHLVQKVGKKMTVALVAIGKEGTGKSIVGRIIGIILGPRYFLDYPNAKAFFCGDCY